MVVYLYIIGTLAVACVLADIYTTVTALRLHIPEKNRLVVAIGVRLYVMLSLTMAIINVAVTKWGVAHVDYVRHAGVRAVSPPHIATYVLLACIIWRGYAAAKNYERIREHRHRFPLGRVD
jgi:hypothetical protein